MNVQKNNANEGIIIEENNLSRYEITFTQNFLEFFTDPNERKFAVDEILDYIINYHITAIDEDFLLMLEGIVPFYSGEAELNLTKFNFYIYWNKEENYQYLIFDKLRNNKRFKFFNINHEENLKMSKVLH